MRGYNIQELLTVTVPLVVREYKAWWARALEAAGGVGAGAKQAVIGLDGTLIDIWKGRAKETRNEEEQLNMRICSVCTC